MTLIQIDLPATLDPPPRLREIDAVMWEMMAKNEIAGAVSVVVAKHHLPPRASA
jgi:hypothetical protein